MKKGNQMSVEEMKQAIGEKLRRHFGCEVKEAGKIELFKACALVARDLMSAKYVDTQNRVEKNSERQVHYLSLEFLMGRSFLNNIYNLGIKDVMEQALYEYGVNITDVLETEPDAGLGNGGLGRLAACYIDSMASLGISAIGYSIRYEHGLFKQKIVDGQQTELPDSWLDVGEAWLIPDMDEVREIKFGGHIEEHWESGRMVAVHKDYTPVLAVPYDMLACGYDTDNVCTLRLWSARSPVELDMKLFSRGEYLKALEQHAMAEVISKILYPDDKHLEGKSLRLKQQYFFVSATVQDIVAKHRTQYGTLKNFAQKHVIQINDTHPAMVVPELMRIFLDEEGYTWEEAWEIVSQCVAYTNHTILAEALEQWPASLFEMHLPRIWSILCEINQRFCGYLWEIYPGDFGKISKLSLICDDMVRMANLSVVSSFSVNGVSELHSAIIRDDVFSDYYRLMPGKFTNVTNGIAHRRWLCEINPKLTDLLCDCIGDDFKKIPSKLADFKGYADDKNVQKRLDEIKHENKLRLSKYIEKANGIKVDPSSIFDVQVKRLHEYKRQLLNVLQILDCYLTIKEHPNMDFVPKTFLFGAKAFPGYYTAKKIIQLICSVASFIEKDEAVRDKLRVVFLENYRVSLAEIIMPAAELSEQISVAGKEASGTGNMKFMINGALTMGTLDGANVEIHEAVGDDNIFLFGLKAHEVNELRPYYNPSMIYASNPRLRAVLDLISHGFDDGVCYQELVSGLLLGDNPDTYMLLADFESYCVAQSQASECYRDRSKWNKMSAINISGAGRFAADRAIDEYAKKIWNVSTNYNA